MSGFRCLYLFTLGIWLSFCSVCFLVLLFESKSVWSGVLGLRYSHTHSNSWKDFWFRTKLSGTGSLLQHSTLQCIRFGFKGRFLSKVDLIHDFTWLN